MTSYSTSSASSRLTAIREAIDRCLSAQSYTIRGREKRSADLKYLLQAEERLMQEVEIEGVGGSMASVGRYVRPT